MSGGKDKLAKELQARFGCTYMAALNGIRNHVARLTRDAGMTPGSARERIAKMTPGEFFGVRR